MGNPRNEKGWPKPQLAIPAPPARAVRVITTRLALSMVGESNDPILALMRHFNLPVTREDYSNSGRRAARGFLSGCGGSFALLRPAPVSQRPAGIGGEYRGQQQPRQPLEQRGVPEPGGTAFAHVLMLCCPPSFVAHGPPGDGIAHKFCTSAVLRSNCRRRRRRICGMTRGEMIARIQLSNAYY